MQLAKTGVRKLTALDVRILPGAGQDFNTCSLYNVSRLLRNLLNETPLFYLPDDAVIDQVVLFLLLTA